MFISELLVTNEIMEQAIEKKWDQPGEMVRSLLAETHPEVWRQFQLFIKKERPREHEAGKMMGPPPKKAKDEKAEETTENVQEESVDYDEFYSKFSQRALDTIRNKFDLIQNHIDKVNGLFHQIEMIRCITGYIDMLQNIFTLVQQIEEKDKRKKKND